MIGAVDGEASEEGTEVAFAAAQEVVDEEASNRLVPPIKYSVCGRPIRLLQCAPG